MSKTAEGNEDWTKREMGRIPTKGAMAAQRASAGLGTSDDDDEPRAGPSPLLTVWAKPARRSRAQGKQV